MIKEVLNEIYPKFPEQSTERSRLRDAAKAANGLLKEVKEAKLVGKDRRSIASAELDDEELFGMDIDD